ncbi:MAG: PAS domain-containing hybrid sensor histidine kinase/response regulator [Candidatus Dadabacteria bacterium]|nr:MAG: PAS domain-containing hybrid sensor histidine kinase/response regulator [Candidatus Dadabacteria bacterium]
MNESHASAMPLAEAASVAPGVSSAAILESCAATRLMLEYALRENGATDVRVCDALDAWLPGLERVDLATIDLDAVDLPDDLDVPGHVYVVGITSDCSWNSVERALRCGARDLLLRPLSESDIRNVLACAARAAGGSLPGEESAERHLLRNMTRLLAERSTRLRELSRNVPPAAPPVEQRQEIRRLEKQLRLLERAKREWEGSVDSLDEVVVITDDRGTVIRINRAAERWGLGTVQELVGRNLVDLLPRELIEKIGWGQPGAETTVDPDGGEWDVVDASERHLHVRMLPVRSSPSPQRRWILILSDQSARRVAEERLRQSEQRLREARKMESIGRIAGGVAHDFNNILTAIKGHAQLLELELPEGSEFAEDVREVLTACTRAEQLTRQLLVFSRRQVLNLCPVDLNELISGLRRSLSATVGESIRLDIETCDEPLTTDADPSLIERIVLNLAQNAADAIDGEGRIVIRTRRRNVDPAEAESLDLADPGAYALIEVEDNGAGIAAENLSQIFEPFFTTKPRGRGTGLGLATVYGSVKQMRGTVSVDSTPGEGTTMSILLPLAEVMALDEEASGRHADAPIERRSVLLVEDDPQVREIARRALANAGYAVLVADGPREAEMRWATHQEYISAVVSDIVMPGKTGLELAQEFTSQRPELPVLYVSGYTDQAVHALGDLPPTQRFLAKPFTPSSLVAALEGLLRESVATQ